MGQQEVGRLGQPGRDGSVNGGGQRQSDQPGPSAGRCCTGQVGRASIVDRSGHDQSFAKGALVRVWRAQRQPLPYHLQRDDLKSHVVRQRGVGTDVSDDQFAQGACAREAKVSQLGVGKGHCEVGGERRLVQRAVVIVQPARPIHGHDERAVALCWPFAQDRGRAGDQGGQLPARGLSALRQCLSNRSEYLGQSAPQWKPRPSAQQCVHYHVGFAHQAAELVPLPVFAGQHDGQSPLLRQAKILVCGGVARLEQVARRARAGLGQVARCHQPVAAVVARPHQHQHAPLPGLSPCCDSFGHRLPGLFHHRRIGVSGRVRGGFNAAHLIYSDDLYNLLLVIQATNRASGLAGLTPCSRYQANVARAPSLNGVGTNPNSRRALSLDTFQS